MKPAVTYTHLTYTYVEGMEDKRVPYRAAHISWLRVFEGRGLLLAGAHINPIDSAEFLFQTDDQANEFIAGDPYRLNGLVSGQVLRKLVVVAGDFLPQG